MIDQQERRQTYYCRNKAGERMAFDVDAALVLAQLFTPKQVPMDLFPRDCKRIFATYEGLDANYAMTSSKLDRDNPILLLQEPTGRPNEMGVRVIDGWHRLYRAKATNASTIWAIVLPWELTDLILLYRVGPGEPIPEGAHS